MELMCICTVDDSCACVGCPIPERMFCFGGCAWGLKGLGLGSMDVERIGELSWLMDLDLEVEI